MHLVLGGDELFGREKSQVGEFATGAAGEGIKEGHAVDLVAEKLHPDRFVIVLGWEELNHIATDTEFTSLKFDLVPLIEHFDKAFQKFLPGHSIPLFYCEDHLEEILWRGQTVDTGNAGDDNDIPSCEQGTRS